MNKRPPFFLRWYGILTALVGIFILALLVVATPLSTVMRSPWRTFYIPSEAMKPGLLKNDRLLALMRAPPETRRGMVVLIDMGGPIYIKRVAALAGDRVEMIDGELFLNGHPVPRRLVGEDRYDDPMTQTSTARRFVERIPGESGTHEIYDTGRTQGDDYPSVVVPAGHVFVLGDNRDHSADSRFSREEMGVGMLPVSDIVGVPLFIYYRSGEGVVNIPINRD